MESTAFFEPLKAYLEAFAENDPVRRVVLLERGLTPAAEIWGPKRVFADYAEISEKIEGFHRNWRGCRLVLASGMNSFQNAARFGKAIVGADGTVLATGHSLVEFASDGRICRVIPFWEALPPFPESWPGHLRMPVQQSNTVVT
jgi:hypothetical protein